MFWFLPIGVGGGGVSYGGIKNSIFTIFIEIIVVVVMVTSSG